VTWVRLLGLEDLPVGARRVAESGQEQYGQLLETWRALFHRPEIFENYLPFLRAVAGPGTVDSKLKDLSALRVGCLNNCRYTVSHRTASARRSGATDDEIVAAASGNWSGFDDATQLVLEFTTRLTEDPSRVAWSERPQLVDASLLAELQRHFTDAQLVELTLSIAVWNALARFHRVMGFDLDMAEPPAEIDPAHHISPHG
jgi:AhpD family alkylhydroperoxidase